MITDERLDEITATLDAHETEHPYGKDSANDPWAIINTLPEYDRDASAERFGGDLDRFALTDGTLIRWDVDSGAWYAYRLCVVCARETESDVTGTIGDVTGRLCEDCQFWADGNITPGK